MADPTTPSNAADSGTQPDDLPSTLGELRASGWTSVPVKHEIRRNAAARIRDGVPLFPHVLGHEDIAQIEVMTGLEMYKNQFLLKRDFDCENGEPE